MYKRLCFLISFVLVLALASTSYGILLGDFENPADPNHDGWLVYDDPNSPADPNASASYSLTIGATSGSYSLRVDADPNTQNAIVYDVIGNGKLDEFRKNLKISLDATRLADEWVQDANSRWSDFAMAINAGSSSGTSWNLWYNIPEQEGDASWLPPDGNEPISIILNYSLAHPQIDYDNLEYVEIILQTNWNGFDPGGTYYIDNIQMFSAGPAYAPSPEDSEREVRPETTLSWTLGAYADKHDVYFGTNFNDVNDANTSDTTGIYRGRRDANTYDPPGFLKSAKTYYWRIDEVNEAGPDPCLWKGDVWQLTTVYPGMGLVIGDWEQNMDGWTTGWEGSPVFDYNQIPETVTLSEYSLGIYWNKGFWVLKWEAPKVPASLANTTLMFDMTAFGSDFENWAEVGEKIALSSDGPSGWKEYEDLATAINRNTGESEGLEFGSWDDIVERTYSLDISDYDLTGATWFNIIISCNTDGGTGKVYFDNARLVDTRLATNPRPLDYAEDVRTEPILSWTPGSQADKHNVYFGTDFDDVNDANLPGLLYYSENLSYDTNSIDIANDIGALSFDTIYYWRVDEVNGLDIAEGTIWTFMTGLYLIVDDFESYSPNPKPLEDTWKASGKAAVSLSTDPAHESAQAMAIDYNNNTPSPYYSEAYADTTGPDSLELDFGKNWLSEGVKALSLWFQGHPDVRGDFNESTYTIEAAGWDIEDTADGFHYAYKELGETYEWEIIAKVVSIEDTGPWAKAGVMFRDSLDPNSRNAAVVMTPNNGVSFQYRTDPAGDTEDAPLAGVTLPHWVRLTRTGAPRKITADHANDVDGKPDLWTEIGPGDWDMALDTPLIGLCVSSFNTRELCTAVFSDVTMLDAPNGDPIPGSWDDQDIGIPYNDPEPMYVVLEDSSDSNGIVYYTDNDNIDPNVTQIGEWTEWRIDLNDFYDQGVELTDVNRIYIGFGDRDDPCEGGSGEMYFDDIRLYTPEFVPGKLPPWQADFVYDGFIDYSDLGVMVNYWLQTPTDPNIDLYVDGSINFKDFAEMGKLWGEEQVWPTW